MNPLWQSRLQEVLEGARVKHAYRQRQVLGSAQSSKVTVDARELLNFSSNDYLGLASCEAVRDAAIESIRHYGVGAGASHLVVGHSEVHQRLECELANWLGRERSLVFSSGYAANVGTLCALLGAKDRVFADKLNHASLHDGVLASGAALRRYRHADTAHLRWLLERESSATGLGMLVTDSVFSMDGDFADLPALAGLAKEYGLLLMVDDAHGLGVLGTSGAGSAESFAMDQQSLPVLVGTFGKALGCAGAFVAGSESLIEYLIQRARQYIYTTAMPPAQAAAVSAAINIVRNEPQRREHLRALIARCSEGLEKLAEEFGLPGQLHSSTAIQPLLIGDNQQTLALSDALRQRDLLVVAIRPPTVPPNTARLRISLSAAHSLQDVETLLGALRESLAALGFGR